MNLLINLKINICGVCIKRLKMSQLWLKSTFLKINSLSGKRNKRSKDLKKSLRNSQLANYKKLNNLKVTSMQLVSVLNNILKPNSHI